MRRAHVDEFPRRGLYPALDCAATSKCKRMDASGADHRQFQITAKRSRCYGLPFHGRMIGQACWRRYETNQFLGETFS